MPQTAYKQGVMRRKNNLFAANMRRLGTAFTLSIYFASNILGIVHISAPPKKKCGIVQVFDKKICGIGFFLCTFAAHLSVRNSRTANTTEQEDKINIYYNSAKMCKFMDCNPKK